MVCLNTSRFSMLARGSVGHTFGVPSRLLSQALRWIYNDVPRKWQVSSEGRCCDTRGRITLGYRHPTGYYYVKISEKLWLVHILVKRTFHGPPSRTKADDVHHKDGNKTNNKLNNFGICNSPPKLDLLLCKLSDKQNAATAHATYNVETCWFHKLCDKPIN